MQTVFTPRFSIACLVISRRTHVPSSLPRSTFRFRFRAGPSPPFAARVNDQIALMLFRQLRQRIEFFSSVERGADAIGDERDVFGARVASRTATSRLLCCVLLAASALNKDANLASFLPVVLSLHCLVSG